jgi:hypothetical protein
MAAIVKWVKGLLAAGFTFVFVRGVLLFLGKRGIHPEQWIAEILNWVSSPETLRAISWMIAGFFGLLALILWPRIENRLRGPIFRKPDVWIYDAAHFIVTKDWRAEQVVGYGKEIMRLRTEGTTLWRSEMNVQTGEQRHIKLTPEEEALAIRNTRVENVNHALEELRQAALNGLPIWSVEDSDVPPKLIDKAYWERYGFEPVTDLKQATAEGLRTRNQKPPNNKPVYHSLKTRKANVETRWPPERRR